MAEAVAWCEEVGVVGGAIGPETIFVTPAVGGGNPRLKLACFVLPQLSFLPTIIPAPSLPDSLSDRRNRRKSKSKGRASPSPSDVQTSVVLDGTRLSPPTAGFARDMFDQPIPFRSPTLRPASPALMPSSPPRVSQTTLGSPMAPFSSAPSASVSLQGSPYHQPRLSLSGQSPLMPGQPGQAPSELSLGDPEFIGRGTSVETSGEEGSGSEGEGGRNRRRRSSGRKLDVDEAISDEYLMWCSPELVSVLYQSSHTHTSLSSVFFGPSTDVFSLALVAFCLLTRGNSHPFGLNPATRVRDMLHRRTPDLSPLERSNGLKGEWVEAQSLLREMLAFDPQRRPSAADVVAVHPYFWGAERRIEFLREAADWLKVEPTSPPSPLIVRLETGARLVLGAELDWPRHIDAEVWMELSKRAKYEGEQVRDLVKAVRNLYTEQPPTVKHLLGPLPHGLYLYFASRFPRLLMHVFATIVGDTRARNDRAFVRFWDGGASEDSVSGAGVGGAGGLKGEGRGGSRSRENRGVLYAMEIAKGEERWVHRELELHDDRDGGNGGAPQQGSRSTSRSRSRSKAPAPAPSSGSSAPSRRGTKSELTAAVHVHMQEQEEQLSQARKSRRRSSDWRGGGDAGGEAGGVGAGAGEVDLDTTAKKNKGHKGKKARGGGHVDTATAKQGRGAGSKSGGDSEPSGDDDDDASETDDDSDLE
ncbi:hypothetical protein M427DRAFT_140622 [Gonapodya prolifera JEL478]|uniref:Protein kinase domain-containing protein n=1 Tax=Gonapodya prolifera (strain JEL478) TaxID=1344416 RepID=A0A138ZZH8_GONPJ|nr:hypothetical protein M427DRAFT_140622 [Gonapodya prolifera JEL478]|eukprot:KXS09675.1 hypothetical protein M427DRAFT_140622 [Gonapodya prolifera JEL478]